MISISGLFDRYGVKYLHHIGFMAFLLLFQSCSFIGLDDTTEKYVAPEPPGEVSFADRHVAIYPLIIDSYIPNPGIGWQHRPETSDLKDFPETVAYSDRRLISWDILNPSDGRYDWSPLDVQLQNAIDSGKQFSFRVYTMLGEEYGGHRIPDWVIQKGAVILESGEPDYSNCVYQEEWGRFVGELVQRYDGDPNIAFIDISGYGNFNEWSWQDIQTDWDTTWQENYLIGVPSPSDFETLDGQARRRLADMFVGGESLAHQCQDANGEEFQIEYSYPGFETTQLLMPYAGIVQSTQYVFSRRQDVGFRYDCLGREANKILEKTGRELLSLWKFSPVVFEICSPEQFDLSDASYLLQEAHASLVHDNEWQLSKEQLEDMMLPVGYRYFLEQADIKWNDDILHVEMKWKNLGYAPSYPKMGQEFQLFFYLLDKNGKQVLVSPADTDISSWMPASAADSNAEVYLVSQDIPIPRSFFRKEYYAGISIVDVRTGNPIQLAFGGRDVNEINVLSVFKLK